MTNAKQRACSFVSLSVVALAVLLFGGQSAAACARPKPDLRYVYVAPWTETSRDIELELTGLKLSVSVKRSGGVLAKYQKTLTPTQVKETRLRVLALQNADTALDKCDPQPMNRLTSTYRPDGLTRLAVYCGPDSPSSVEYSRTETAVAPLLALFGEKLPNR